MPSLTVSLAPPRTFIAAITLLTAVGTAASASAPGAAKAPAAASLPVPSTPDEIAAVRATFVDPVLAAAIPTPAKATATAPDARPAPAKLTPWTSYTPDIAADLRAEPQPAYYVYQDRAIRLALDPDRLAVKFEGDAPEETVRKAAAEAGLPVASLQSLNVGGWWIIELALPSRNAADTEARVLALSARPGVAFASPVFHHPTVLGGWTIPTPDIVARVKQPDLNRGAPIVANAAPDLRVVTDAVGALPGAYQLRLNDKNGFDALRRANAFAQSGDFAWAEPDFLQSAQMDLIPNDPSFGNSWGLRNTAQFVGAVNDVDTDADEAWDYTTGRSSIITLVMDVGVEQNHPDINQNAGRDFTTGVVAGIAGGGPGTGCDRHGTSVAGIISGRINNSLGTAGVAPGTRIISARTAVEVTTPACSSTYSAFSGTWLANALAWGLGQGARISNSSFGVGQSATIDNAYSNADNNGIVNFASSGNGGADGIGDPTIGYPSSASGVQAVGAIDFNGVRSSFSNWGTGLQFSLPGTNVYTADRQGALGYASGDYTYFGGTSAASPFAAGCAALIWSIRPDMFPSTLVTLMKITARDLGPAGFDTDYGWGLPNVRDAIDFNTNANDWCVTATPIPTLAYNPAPFSTSAYVEVPDEPQESCEFNNNGVSHTVWYSFVPICTGTIDLNTVGSDYDTVLAVFRGSCASPIAVACNDDAVGLQSQLTGVGVVAGLTYYIKVSGYLSASGNLDFNFLYNPPSVSNDSCSSPTIVPPTASVYSDGFHCITGATTACEGDETCEFNNVGISHSVWYEFSPRYSGRVTTDTNGSSFDTVLSIWQGCALILAFPPNPPLCLTNFTTELACDDDSGAGTASVIAGFKLLKGQTYKFKAAAYGTSNPGGSLDFNLAYTSCPADFDASGAVAPADIFAFLNAYFAATGDTDFNANSIRDPGDIFAFLNIYFAGCPGF